VVWSFLYRVICGVFQLLALRLRSSMVNRPVGYSSSF